MNATEQLVMTGSLHPRSEQLAWLSEVASAVSKGTLNRHNSTIQDQNVGNQTSSTLLAPDPAAIFIPPASISRTTDKVKMFSPPYQVDRNRHVQTISLPTVSSTGATLYYSQAPRSTPYANIFQTTNPPTVTFSNHPSTVVSQIPDTQHSYLQVDNYPSLIGVKTISSPHSHLSYSTAYLHPTISSNSANLTLSDRVFQQGRSILLSQPIEGMVVQERDLNNDAIQLSSALVNDNTPKKSFPNSNVISGSSNCNFIIETSPIVDFSLQRTSPSQEEYKMPTGKEGSLKHRILRPPSINIVDPSPIFVSDAPLSAPPIRTQQDLSPKHTRSIPSSGYRSFSSSASSLAESTRLISSCGTSPGGNLVNQHSSLSSESPSPAPTDAPQLKYPQSFNKGAIIQLANNQFKPVENLTTEDFIECGTLSPTLKIDCSTVTSIEKTPATGAVRLSFQVGPENIQVTVEAPLEHPFFVYKQGWSSCSPERSAQRYGLTCYKLKIGDICVSITDKPHTPSDSEQKVANVSVPTSAKKNSAEPSSKKDRNKPSDKILSSSENATILDKSFHEPNDTKAELSTVSRKRKRRWSAPDNISPSEENSEN